ncbi:hypothetical protein Pla163_09890 [Planctomycetes bacterium Pla163]|uniref:Pseudopilin GspJ n=1 Tax=Rohdeia mirabilis TaxID=2528008 RepID=A0A518CXF1_9BACT|nr:hypothetical protein Pla163_09890 [Planctomycetes bacterium Pla163]
MIGRWTSGHAARRGLTLIELVLALGLFALLSLMVVQLLDSTMRVWGRAEAQRYAIGTHSTLSSQILDELDQLAGGERGDLLIDWEIFDTDGDLIATRPLPRLRFVRRATAADMNRLGQREIDPNDPTTARLRGGELPLLEVVYCVLPSEIEGLLETGELAEGMPGAPGDVVLWRGERLLDDASRPSAFDDDFFLNGFPPTGSAEPVHDGILWVELLCAGRGTRLDRGWRVGTTPQDAARAWDAHGGGRLDTALHPFNAPYMGQGTYRGEPLFPRRVRLVLEVEGPSDAKRRAALAEPLTPEAIEMVVRDPQLLPPAGTLVLMGEEWVKISQPGTRTRIERAQRGTAPRPHRVGTPLQYGRRFEREVRIPLFREDWRS